ncbi:ankyrin repeat protein [Paraburkholderia fungorum]|jgi:hypothetical protein|uniref:ankyrin repeat domain-containing protein n=1 Tax=Paraburkholderia fungorum TaxID=134537 RepID=UPI000D43B5A0|nr:ankyrin repeat domain-containing protein [Paraburkholderia fungorum]PRZ56421.1 ankyrin repeat protein [Paraburkholderia fungorum]
MNSTRAKQAQQLMVAQQPMRVAGQTFGPMSGPMEGAERGGLFEFPIDDAQLIRLDVRLDGEGDASNAHERAAPAISASSRALIRAAAAGRSRDVDRLLALPDVDPEAVDEWGFTALSAAAMHGHARCVKRLLPRCDANRIVSGATALHDAAMQGHAACVRLLISVSDANATIGPGLTPLMLATMENRAQCVELLLPHADARATDSIGSTALMRAARHGHADCVATLLPASDAKARDHDGCAAIQSAIACGKAECADLLSLHSERSEAAEAFAKFGPAGMPRWLAQIEFESLGQIVGAGPAGESVTGACSGRSEGGGGACAARAEGAEAGRIAPNAKAAKRL